MHRLTSKFKLCLYLFFLIFLSSSFNFKLNESYQNIFKLKIININGLPHKETKIVERVLNNFKNTNIFKINEDNILKKLDKLKFLENIYVNKIIPSSININLSKTSILGETQINGKRSYIGKNGKFINVNQVSQPNNIPIVFGDFNVKDYINLIKILKKYKLDIRNIDNFYYYKNNRWDLQFSNGLTLMLPSNKLEDSIKIYKLLLKEGNLLNTKIVDLRVKDQIILTSNNE
tara:strand:+ start:90 stop:785 length:696 start_codon:yes stop_codon:yes gene_type:complete